MNLFQPRRLSAFITRIAMAIVLITVLQPASHAATPYQLENGLTVILHPIPTAPQVAVVLLYNLGGDHDPAGKSGQAHLLEHLYVTAAAGEVPARDVSAILKRYPNGFNQQTGFDYTVLAGVIPPDQLSDELLDTAKRMSDLHIEASDLQREIPRVLQELKNMYGGIPALAGINHVRMKLHPVVEGGRHGGQPDAIQSITLKELQAFWKDYYKPTNAVLVLAGKFETEDTKKLIKQHFGDIPSGKSPLDIIPSPNAETGTSHHIQVKPNIAQAKGIVSFGIAAPQPGTRDYAPFLLVVSRLWSLYQASLKAGQIQPIYYPMLDDSRTLALQMRWEKDVDPETLLDQLDKQLQTALTPTVKPQEKQQALNAMAMLGTVEVADALWVRNLYGLAFSVGRRHQLNIDGRALREAIQKVTANDLERLASEVFGKKKRIAVMVEIEE